MAEAGLLKHRRGQIGVNVVERIVLRDWSSRWQPLDAVNDDGIDGLIFIERGGTPTGEIVHVQVKCRSEKASNGRFALPISTQKLARNAARWRRVVGAAILVKVNPMTLEAHWVDLKTKDTVGKSQVYVPATNIYNAQAKNQISDLCGTLHGDLLLPQVRTTADNFSYLGSTIHPKAGARLLYRHLNQSKLVFEGSSQPIHFTREGWRHLNRHSREPMARLHSWNLLGTIPHIIRAVPESSLQIVRPAKGLYPTLVSATATVLFPFRQACVVRAIFRRRGDNQHADYSFHTIYEPRRKRNLAGL